MSMEIVDQKTGEVTERKVKLSPAQVELLQKTICKDHTPDQIELFLEYCQSKGLDPFGREVYSIIRKGRPTFQIGIDGLRGKAEESGEYDGQSTQWCGEDGVWKDIWISSLPPYAAKVEVHRRGCEHPFIGIALWTEYKPAEDDWMWRKMPSSQLGKCAEAIALRRAFPRKLGGLYSSEEMEQAGKGQEGPKTPKIAMPKPKAVQSEETAEIVESRGASDAEHDPVEYPEPTIVHSEVEKARQALAKKPIAEEFSEPPHGMNAEHTAAFDAQNQAKLTPVTKEELEKKLKPPVSKFFAALHETVRKAGVSDAKMKKTISVLFNAESSKDLTDKQCADLIKLIEKGGLK